MPTLMLHDDRPACPTGHRRRVEMYRGCVVITNGQHYMRFGSECRGNK